MDIPKYRCMEIYWYPIYRYGISELSIYRNDTLTQYIDISKIVAALHANRMHKFDLEYRYVDMACRYIVMML